MYFHVQVELKDQNEDYAAETDKKRCTLYPIVKAARHLPQYKDKVRLHKDKLRVDGRTYTVENMLDLPTPLNPTTLPTKVEECLVRFFGKASSLSNFHPSKIKINGALYSCNEQQYQKGKADEFEDKEAAAKIMATTNPSEMYSIGQTIKAFEARRWSQVCDSIMLRGLKEKFCDPKSNKQLWKGYNLMGDLLMQVGT